MPISINHQFLLAMLWADLIYLFIYFNSCGVNNQFWVLSLFFFVMIPVRSNVGILVLVSSTKLLTRSFADFCH
jgi:hypothetical protein